MAVASKPALNLAKPVAPASRPTSASGLPSQFPSHLEHSHAAVAPAHSHQVFEHQAPAVSENKENDAGLMNHAAAAAPASHHSHSLSSQAPPPPSGPGIPFFSALFSCSMLLVLCSCWTGGHMRSRRLAPIQRGRQRIQNRNAAVLRRAGGAPFPCRLSFPFLIPKFSLSDLLLFHDTTNAAEARSQSRVHEAAD